jgi:ABC-type phosphate transport system ATPase subunit
MSPGYQTSQSLWYASHPIGRKSLPMKRPDIGVPTYRTYVQYIPQRPSLLPGTPRDLFETLSTFHARLTPERSSEGHGRINSAMTLAEQWGIAKELWDRPWSLLSVGESQRLSLAIAYGFNRAEVLMLDGAYLFLFTIATRFSFLIYSGICKNRHPDLTPHCPRW